MENNIFSKDWWADKLQLNENDNDEVIDKVIKGFNLVKSKGFSNAYKTTNGSASRVLADRINKFIKDKLKTDIVRFRYEATYATVNWYSPTNEIKIQNPYLFKAKKFGSNEIYTYYEALFNDGSLATLLVYHDNTKEFKIDLRKNNAQSLINKLKEYHVPYKSKDKGITIEIIIPIEYGDIEDSLDEIKVAQTPLFDKLKKGENYKITYKSPFDTELTGDFKIIDMDHDLSDSEDKWAVCKPLTNIDRQTPQEEDDDIILIYPEDIISVKPLIDEIKISDPSHLKVKSKSGASYKIEFPGGEIKIFYWSSKYKQFFMAISDKADLEKETEIFRKYHIKYKLDGVVPNYEIVWIDNKYIDNKLDEIKVQKSPLLKAVPLHGPDEFGQWYTIHFPGGEEEEFYYYKESDSPEYYNTFSLTTSGSKDITRIKNLFDKYQIQYKAKDPIISFSIQNTDLNSLKEIKVQPAKKIWDFTKYIHDFNPTSIKVGDSIRTKPNANNPHDENVVTKIEDTSDNEAFFNGDLFFYFGDLFNTGFGSDELTRINEKHKKRQGIQESISKDKLQQLKDFVKFACTELQIPSTVKCKIKITGKQIDGSFANYNPSNDAINVYFGNRHIADVMRSVAHELKHLKQKLNGEQLDGTTGSQCENDANAVAGEIMRKYKDVNPGIFKESLNEIKIQKTPKHSYKPKSNQTELENKLVGNDYYQLIDEFDNIIDHTYRIYKNGRYTGKGTFIKDRASSLFQQVTSLNEIKIQPKLSYYKIGDGEKVVKSELIDKKYCQLIHNKDKNEYSIYVNGNYAGISCNDLLDALEEFERRKLYEAQVFGTHLFGGEDTGVKIKWYDKEEEQDTQSEEELFNHISTYVKGNRDQYGNLDLAPLIPLFKQLKKQYPEIVDPKLSGEAYVYRGTSISEETLKKFSNNKQEPYNDSSYVIFDIPYNPRKKVQSWSTEYFPAASFAMSNETHAINTTGKKQIGVVMRVKAKDADLYFNPKFIDLINNLKEEEILNIKSPLRVDLIVIDFNEFDPDDVWEGKEFSKEWWNEHLGLDEIKVEKSGKLWDFTEYIPNFIPEKIQIGDKIRINRKGDGQVEDREIVKIRRDIDEDRFFSFDEGMGNGYFTSNLLRINFHNKNKVNEIKVVPQHNEPLSQKSLGKVLNPASKYKNIPYNLKIVPFSDFESKYKEYSKFIKFLLNFTQIFSPETTKEEIKTYQLGLGFAFQLNINNNKILIFKGTNSAVNYKVNSGDWNHALGRIGAPTDGIYSPNGYLSFKNYVALMKLPNGKQEVLDMLEINKLEEIKVQQQSNVFNIKDENDQNNLILKAQENHWLCYDGESVDTYSIKIGKSYKMIPFHGKHSGILYLVYPEDEKPYKNEIFEIKVTNNKTLDFREYIPDFDEKSLRVGDTFLVPNGGGNAEEKLIWKIDELMPDKMLRYWVNKNENATTYWTYNGLKDLNDWHKPVNEIKVEQSSRIWNFTKYIPNFDHKNIKIGDTIKTGFDKDDGIVVGGIDKTYTSSYFFHNGERVGYESDQLIKINNINKQNNIDEIKIKDTNDITVKDVMYSYYSKEVKEREPIIRNYMKDKMNDTVLYTMNNLDKKDLHSLHAELSKLPNHDQYEGE